MDKPKVSKSGRHATVLIGMSEILTIILTETPNYPLSACISDIGGAAGLFLGLNVIGGQITSAGKCGAFHDSEQKW